MLLGITIPERQWRWRVNPHVGVHQDPAGRVRRSPALAVRSHRVLHTLRPKFEPRQSLQYRRKLRPRPHMEKLPKTLKGTGRARLRFPKVRLSRNAQKEKFRQGRRHVSQGQS